MQGESLFNDGIGVVTFLTILGLAQSGVENFSIGGTVGPFGLEGGGWRLGGLLGAGFWFLRFKIGLEIIDNAHG